LEQRMSGADVSSLQSFLAKDVAIYPQGLVTGYFGTLTASAVSNFQSRNGLPSVGRVGPMTLAAINSKMNGDSASPWINAVNVNVSNTSAALSWSTNENSSSVLYYGTSPLSMTEGNSAGSVTIGGSSVLVDTNLQTSHSTNLTALVPNTTYYYVVYVRDGAGNESITWPSTFHTNQ
jgi:peptidoglycan hydrolase-like protein with peptidoglycan-binding domain